MNNDAKTTIAGVAKLIVAVCAIIGVSVSPENQDAIVAGGVALYTTLSAVVAYFTNKA